jgi:hypothetical protein
MRVSEPPFRRRFFLDIYFMRCGAVLRTRVSRNHRGTGQFEPRDKTDRVCPARVRAQSDLVPKVSISLSFSHDIFVEDWNSEIRPACNAGRVVDAICPPTRAAEFVSQSVFVTESQPRTATLPRLFGCIHRGDIRYIQIIDDRQLSHFEKYPFETP